MFPLMLDCHGTDEAHVVALLFGEEGDLPPVVAGRLHADQRGDTSVYIDARITPGGDLQLYGQDIGRPRRSLSGTATTSTGSPSPASIKRPNSSPSDQGAVRRRLLSGNRVSILC